MLLRRCALLNASRPVILENLCELPVVDKYGNKQILIQGSTQFLWNLGPGLKVERGGYT